MPRNVASAAPISYDGADFDADVKAYRGALDAKQLDLARTKRDQIVYRVVAQIDAAYGAFESSLSNGRAAYQTGGDAAQLGLTAAATVVGATEIKDILSATSIALQGTRLSFDKNFFEQKTTEALVAQMRASRKTLQAQLIRSLGTRDVGSYPLEAAWIDVVGYYYAGTISSALVEISSKAGAADTAAQQDLKKAVDEITPATPAQAKQAVSVRAAYNAISKQISSGDQAQINQATGNLRKILDAAGVTYSADASASDLLKAMQSAMHDAIGDHALLQKLNDAVQTTAAP